MNNAVFLFGFLCVLLIPGADSDEIACPRQVTGVKYGKVSFKCFYSDKPAANKYSRKYCCLQGTRPGSCKYTVVSSNDYVASQFMNRIELQDKKEQYYFKVTIDGLQKEDEGNYICGIGMANGRIKNLVSLSVVEDEVKDTQAQLIYAQLGGTAIFKCDYKDTTTQRRSLCKVTKNGCINVMDSTGRTGSSYDGRVSVESQEAGTFIVKMVQIRDSDAAFYTCSSDNTKESIHPPYDLRINDETDIPQVSASLTPRLGGSLSAQCYYNPKKNYTKMFWCKLQDGICNPIITKDGYVMDAYEGRVLIHDNATSGLMQVLMDNISKEDEGWYWCVMTNEKHDKHDQTSAIQVRISTENVPGLSGSKRVRATAGDPVKLTCSYPCRFKNAEKYWCLWSNHGCKPMSNVEDTQDPQLVNCKTEELSLNFESVSLKDSGFYWCGVKHGNTYGDIMGVQLIVEETTRDISNTNVRANFDQDPGNGNRKEAVETPPSTDNKSGTVTAAVVSVCVAVLVACALFLFLRFRKKKNSDLVSVGSYRTNISMTDLDNNVGKENPGVTDLQETDINRSEGSPKSKKKGSREDLDYSCFLINHVGAPNEQVTE